MRKLLLVLIVILLSAGSAWAGYELKTNTAVRIAVGPLVDPTDGKTAEVGLTVTALSVQLYQVKTDGTAVVRTQFAPTASGGSNDMALVTSSTDGMYDLELTAAQLNFLGNGRISFYDVDGFLVHWIDLSIVSANYFDNKYGSTIETVNATQISGDSTAADNAESFFDGTGYAGTGNTIPTVTTLTGHTAQTGDSYAIVNGDHGLVSIQDDVDNVLVDTNSLNDTKVPDTISLANINGQVDTALSDIHLDHLLAADYDPASKPGTATALLNEVVENDGGVSRFTENALEQAPSGTGASAATIADAVWDEAQADHVGAGTFGVTASEIADILVDTATLPADPASETNVDANETKIDTIDTNVDSIKDTVERLPR